jgi:hypothetical protein
MPASPELLLQEAGGLSVILQISQIASPVSMDPSALICVCLDCSHEPNTAPGLQVLISECSYGPGRTVGGFLSSQ